VLRWPHNAQLTHHSRGARSRASHFPFIIPNPTLSHTFPPLARNRLQPVIPCQRSTSIPFLSRLSHLCKLLSNIQSVNNVLCFLVNIALHYVPSSSAIAMPLDPPFLDSKSFLFRRFRTLPFSVSRKSFACLPAVASHSLVPSEVEGYENCRVCINNSHSGSPRAPRGTRRAPLTKPFPALSFQALTNCPLRNLFLLITMQTAGGVGGALLNSLPIPNGEP